MRSPDRSVVVADLNDYLEPTGLFSQDARGRLGEKLSRIVEAATSHPPDRRVAVAVPCGPGRQRRCAGWLQASWSRGMRGEADALVTFACPVCGWQGDISGWAGSPFDMGPHRRGRPRPRLALRITAQDFVAVHGVDLMSLEHPMPVTAATLVAGQVRISGDETDLGELRSALVASADPATGKRERDALDRVAVGILRVLEQGRQRRRRSGPATRPEEVNADWLKAQVAAMFPLGGTVGTALAAVLDRTATDAVAAIQSKSRLRSTIVSAQDPLRTSIALAAYLAEAASLGRRDRAAALDMLLFAAGVIGESELREGLAEAVQRIVRDAIAAARGSVRMKEAMLMLVGLFLRDERFDPLVEFLGDRHAGRRGRRYLREIVQSTIERQGASRRTTVLLRALAQHEQRVH